MMQDVGRIIKQLRQQRGLSQEQLAKQAGLSRYTVCKYEQGIQLSLDGLHRLSGVLPEILKLVEATEPRSRYMPPGPTSKGFPRLRTDWPIRMRSGEEANKYWAYIHYLMPRDTLSRLKDYCKANQMHCGYAIHEAILNWLNQGGAVEEGAGAEPDGAINPELLGWIDKMAAKTGKTRKQWLDGIIQSRKQQIERGY